MSMRIALLSLSAAVLFSGCASMGAQNEETSQRLAAIEERLEQVERLVDSDSLLDLATRLEEVETELRSLRGDVEMLQHELEGARERQRELYLDVDRRLRRLEVGGSAAASSGGEFSLPGDDTASSSGGEAGGAPSGSRDSDSDGGGSSGSSPQAQYEAAFELLRDGRYDAAGESFRSFLDEHPDSRLGANARYWLGEVHYVTRAFEEAVAEFQRVIDDYPESGKVPDAHLKLGFTYYELERWDEARQHLETVVENYPDSSVARLARTRLDRMAEEGH
jgi:tol-pal system protein YbgF